MSRHAAFLNDPAPTHNDNHARLPRLFEQAGWHVYETSYDALTWRSGSVLLGDRPADDFDLIWPVGLGPRQTFYDRQQLMSLIAQHRLITPIAAYAELHGKSRWLQHAPPTMVAASSEALIGFYEEHRGTWVLKPVAGSFGKDVVLINSAAEIDAHVSCDRFWMLQRFIPEIREGETRTLVCGDHVIGSYLRIPTRGLRANLNADGRAAAAELDPDEQALVASVQARLAAHGVGYAAIDTVGGYLMEVNLANPGGLGTLSELYGEGPGKRLMQAIDARCRARQISPTNPRPGPE